MATTWTVDEPADEFIDGPDGVELHRNGKLVNVETSGPGPRRIWDAARDTKVPARGAGHPYIPGMVVASVSVRMIDTSNAHVSIVYKLFGIPGVTDPAPTNIPLGRVSVDTSTQLLDTPFYRVNEGGREVKKQITLKHKFKDVLFNVGINPGAVKKPVKGDVYRGGVVINDPAYRKIESPSDFPPGSEQGDSWVKAPFIECEQVGTVSAPVTFVHVGYERIEAQNPQDKSRRYVGKVNKTPVFGDPPHFWLCSAIRGATEDGGQSYTVNYEFSYNPDSWDATVVYHDTDTDSPVVDPKDGVGLRTLRVTGEADFLRLDLRV